MKPRHDTWDSHQFAAINSGRIAHTPSTIVDLGLGFGVKTGETWIAEYTIIMQCASGSAGIKFYINGPSADVTNYLATFAQTTDTGTFAMGEIGGSQTFTTSPAHGTPYFTGSGLGIVKAYLYLPIIVADGTVNLAVVPGSDFHGTQYEGAVVKFQRIS